MIPHNLSIDIRLLIARYLADVAEPLRGDDEHRTHVLALDSMSQAVLTLPAGEDVLQEVARYCVVNREFQPNEAFKGRVDQLTSTNWATAFLTEIVADSKST